MVSITFNSFLNFQIPLNQPIIIVFKVISIYNLVKGSYPDPSTINDQLTATLPMLPVKAIHVEYQREQTEGLRWP